LRSRRFAIEAGDCSARAVESSNYDHTDAPLTNDHQLKSARDRVSQSNACSLQARQGWVIHSLRIGAQCVCAREVQVCCFGGVSGGGGLRWPYGAISGALRIGAVQPTAAFSQQIDVASRMAGNPRE